jgi:hypothetical protein
MPEMAPVPKDHLMGSLWAVFVAGFIAGAKWQKPTAEPSKQPTYDEGLVIGLFES